MRKKRITTRPAMSPERVAWLELGHELGFSPGIDPAQPSTRIAADLAAEVSSRKLAWTRTQLNKILEARTGKRSPAAGRSRDKVRIVDLS